MSLLTFNASDPSLNHVVSGHAEVLNKAGLFGAYTAGFLNDVFGVTALLCPLVFAALGAAYVSPAYAVHWWRWCGLFLLTLCLLVISSAWDFSIGDLWGGGMVGNALHGNASRYLSPGGSALLWFFILLTGLQLACNISWFSLLARLSDYIRHYFNARAARLAGSAGKGLRNTSGNSAGTASGNGVADIGKAPLTWALPSQLLSRLMDKAFWARWRDKLGDIHPTASNLPDVFDEKGQPHNADDSDDIFARSEDVRNPAASHSALTGANNVVASATDAQAVDAPPLVEMPRAVEPPLEAMPITVDEVPSIPAAAAGAIVAKKPILGSLMAAAFGRKAPVPLPSLDLLVPPAKISASVREDREGRGRALIACMKDFDIQGELVRITPGPVVTMYEFRPAPGVRVSRIANLSDDLSLALRAVAIRIQAPIPGSDTVGIEIPNDNRETVNFRELAASEEFRQGCGPLTMILGKDIAGRPFMADLSRMPHLLVAGATGAGKSVCLNGILASLLYRTQPQDMRLLLIDPKRIEMAVYADEPHLVHPVVTEMSEAKSALDWAVHEMDRRYEAMARLGVRNVAGFNQKLATFKNEMPPDMADLEPLPYLVIVIDELADLMMTAAREVETSIVRLAQLARAAGIHLILATQRPSVDVVTGLIKANFPCRISFQVTSKHDSRTILDQVGAEHLLGRGDMLFKPSGGRLQRLHGPFLSDEEVQNVVSHWKHHLSPSYKVDFAEWGVETGGGQGTGGGDAANDPLYGEVQAFVSDQGRASISLVQRRFKIGFNRAARLVEQLEHDGIIGPADGSKPRPVVR